MQTGDTERLTGVDVLLALKSSISQAVMARPLRVSDPATSKILPFSEVVFCSGHKNEVP